MGHLKRTVLSEGRKALQDPWGKQRASRPPVPSSRLAVTGAPGQRDPWLPGGSPRHRGDFSVLFGVSLHPTVTPAACFLNIRAVYSSVSAPARVMPDFSSGGLLRSRGTSRCFGGSRKE